MPNALLTFLVMTICMFASPVADAQQMVFVVRHGEKLDDGKDSWDPPLSSMGEARAARLAQMLALSGVTAIYTTQYQRSIQFAAPFARALKIVPVVNSAGDTAGLLKKIATHAAGDVLLVVGHSNTVPLILKGLGYPGEIAIEETEFDHFFVLVLKAQGAPALVRLKY